MSLSLQEWARIRDEIASKLDLADPAELLAQLDQLADKTYESDSIAREIHALRGELQILCGQSHEAQQSFREALIHANATLYPKYVTELRLGDITADATWYARALRTALAHGSFSCGDALVSLLERAIDSPLDQSTSSLVTECIDMSWSRLRLPGQPSMDRLDAARRILDAEKGGD